MKVFLIDLSGLISTFCPQNVNGTVLEAGNDFYTIAVKYAAVKSNNSIIYKRSGICLKYWEYLGI